MKYVSTVNGVEYLIEIVDERHIIVNGKMLTVDFNSVSGSRSIRCWWTAIPSRASFIRARRSGKYY
jgi:hypothetical protein